jgi:hypothetical protein|tara:strand:- start:646 stop:948 length:303 start_codon:yes stop_codon:yes gene_type:complete
MPPELCNAYIVPALPSFVHFTQVDVVPEKVHSSQPSSHGSHVTVPVAPMTLAKPLLQSHEVPNVFGAEFAQHVLHTRLLFIVHGVSSYWVNVHSTHFVHG